MQVSICKAELKDTYAKKMLSSNLLIPMQSKETEVIVYRK